MRTADQKKGFTLIELLVVMSIIGLLSSIVLTSLSQARSKGRDAKRLRDLKEVQTALELYRITNGKYPTYGDSAWKGLCPTYNGSGTYTTSGPTGYIPDLAPNYIKELPEDPKPVGSSGCYIYRSNASGSEYMFLIYTTVEGAIIPSLTRPVSPGVRSYAAYSTGASGW